MFQIPDNLSRLDENPQLLLFSHNSSYTGSIVAVSNGTTVSSDIRELYGDNGILGDTLFRNAQAVQSAALSSGGESIIYDRYNTIQLNQLGKYYAGFLKGNFVITLVNEQYDFGNTPSTPAGSRDAHNTTTFRPPGHANGPVLVLRKPWFIDSQGNEFPLEKDYTINAFQVQANQRNRAVQQLPFSTAIRGPASMRFRNNSPGS